MGCLVYFMLKSSTHIGSKDIQPTMHVNDRVLLGRMYILYRAGHVLTRSPSIKAQIRKVYLDNVYFTDGFY